MIEPRTDDWALICPHCGCRHTTYTQAEQAAEAWCRGEDLP